MVQTEETKEYKTPEKGELYTIPHQLGRMRKRTSDKNDLDNDADSTTGNGIGKQIFLCEEWYFNA